MKFSKDKLTLLLNKIKISCFSYRVTVAGVIVATLYAAVCYILDNIYLKDETLIGFFLDYEPAVLRFLLLFILAVMFVESIFTYEKSGKHIRAIRSLCCVLSAIIAAAFVGVYEWTFASDFSVIAAWAMRYYIACILLLMLGIIYLCHRKTGVDFIEYMMHVCVNFCITTSIYFVLCIGIVLVLLVFELLFFEVFYLLGGCSMILITGFYFVPACITSLGNMDSNIDDEISMVLIRKVLSGMTVCAMAIVYAYLLKILVTWQMPSNEIFGIVSGLFCIGMFIWVMDYYYRDDTKYTVFLQRLPYGMIPMIPVQTYAMCVRIYHNGMTPGRYAGMLFVVFEIIMLLIWRFRRGKMEQTVLVTGACVIIAVVLPGINMYSVSNRWQKSYLVTYYNKVLAQEELTKEEYNHLEGAYKYLRRQPEMEGTAAQYDINDEDFTKLLAWSVTDTEPLTNLQSHYIHCCQLVGTIDVEGYSRFDMVNQDPQYKETNYKTEEDKPAVDFSAFRFYVRSSGKEDMIEVDISDFANKCFAYEEEFPDATQEETSDAMRPYQKIVIDDHTVLYLNHFEVRYTDGVKDGEEYLDWSRVNISGMLLSN